MLAWIRGILAKPTQPVGHAFAKAHAGTKAHAGAKARAGAEAEADGADAQVTDAPDDYRSPSDGPNAAAGARLTAHAKNRIADAPRVDPDFFDSFTSQPADDTAEPDVFSLRLRVHVPAEDQPLRPVPAKPSPKRSRRKQRPAPPWRSHRPIADHVSLRDARLGSPRQHAHLAALGIESIGDLLREPSMHLRRAGLSRRAIQTVDAWRDAVRLQREVPPLRLCDARLLVAIHRRSIQDLARSKPARLTLDLQRFAWSSQGQRLLGKRQLPTRAHAQRWIDSARLCQTKNLNG